MEQSMEAETAEEILLRIGADEEMIAEVHRKMLLDAKDFDEIYSVWNITSHSGSKMQLSIEKNIVEVLSDKLSTATNPSKLGLLWSNLLKNGIIVQGSEIDESISIKMDELIMDELGIANKP